MKTDGARILGSSDTTLPPAVHHEAYKDDLTDLPPALSRFVLAGYTALDTASGDLNLDTLTDYLLVLKKNGEDTLSDVTEHPSKRPLLILTGQADGSYKLAARSENTVLCIDCGGMMGDPFMNLVIKHGYFSVEHYGGSNLRWESTVTFKYAPQDQYWYLHKDGTRSFYATDPEKVEEKIRTVKDFGRVRFDEFSSY